MYIVYAYCKSWPKKGNCNIPAGIAKKKIYIHISVQVTCVIQWHNSYLLHLLESNCTHSLLKDLRPI